jgi:hypothetical protein
MGGDMIAADHPEDAQFRQARKVAVTHCSLTYAPLPMFATPCRRIPCAASVFLHACKSVYRGAV